MARVAVYGSWRSPITSELIAAGSIRLEQAAVDGDSAYWIETRPAEGGRSVIVCRTGPGETRDVTPAPWSARTRVHEYGGGAFAVADGVVYFANWSDQRLYRQRPDATPEPIVPEGSWRYADLVVDRGRDRLVCVREDHSAPGREAVNALAAVSVDGGTAVRVLVAGRDFYASPRPSPDGARLAWLEWSHPNMPWDGTELWVGELEPDGTITRRELVAGGPDESIFQPSWSPDGVLHFVSDRTGWWNLYRWRGGGVESLCPMDAEWGQPQWRFAMSTYGFVSSQEVVGIVESHGARRLLSLDTLAGTTREIAIPYTFLRDASGEAGRVIVHAASPTESLALVEVEAATGRISVLRSTFEARIDPGYLSTPRPIEFPTERGLTAHGLYYLPRNRDHDAPRGERPPLLVKSHGGPTAPVAMALNLEIQFWTSRGFAVLDVAYGGSTGYGRAYRRRLDGQWGVVDVEDCVNGARALVARGEVDGRRLAIDGASAGGYTTLCALAFRDEFRAGASHYGIGDLEALARDTHKFESRYLDRLVGPYPERRDLYRARSPIHAVDRLSCPVIFFQGLEDAIVPPTQAETMVAALRAKGVPVAYVPFEGEQHGFRRAESIKRALDAELYFFSRVFDFPLGAPVEPIRIENL